MWILALLFSLMTMSCASLPPPPVDKKPSTAMAQPGETALGKIVQASAPRPGASGFLLETSGNQAFDNRLALIDRAERSLDLQYYIIEKDESVRTIMNHLRRAAARGVHVRLLVDDMSTVGLDMAYLRIDAHPNIEV
ncbi:MAG TPA: phospholipase D-like domain-containing protein, partial [Burkholderiaceae bacterium]